MEAPPPGPFPEPGRARFVDAPAGPVTGERRRRNVIAPLRRGLRGAGDFVRRVYETAADDNIFFLAGAIAFNMIIAFIPLLLAVVGIAGTILRVRYADPVATLLEYLLGSLPPVSAEFRDGTYKLLQELLEKSAGLLSIGTAILIWVATRLIGTLRTVLREIFDIQQERSMVRGKIFDIQMVFAAGVLFSINVALTVAVELAARFGTDLLRVRPLWVPSPQLYGRVLALATIWVMFLLIYRYLPARRIRWSTALVAATFTATCFELLKQGFAWYMTRVADYASTYSYLATLVILIVWIYYVAIVFILGGEVAQVVAMQRIRRRQKERLR